MSIYNSYHSGRTQSKRREFSRKHHGDSRDLQCRYCKAVMGREVRKEMKTNLSRAQRRAADFELDAGLEEYYSAGEV